MGPVSSSSTPAGPVPAEVTAAIAAVIDSLWTRAERGYARHQARPGTQPCGPHLFEQLKLLKTWLGTPPAGYYRSLLMVEVLSAMPGAASADLAGVAWQIDQGQAFGRVTPLVADERLPAAAVAALLSAYGCDPELVIPWDDPFWDEHYETARRIIITERAPGQWWSVPRTGHTRGPYPSRAAADAAQEWDLCDACCRTVTGLPAECQDECSLPLDHAGLCGPRPQSGPQRCQRCGEAGRLTHTGPQECDEIRAWFPHEEILLDDGTPYVRTRNGRYELRFFPPSHAEIHRDGAGELASFPVQEDRNLPAGQLAVITMEYLRGILAGYVRTARPAAIVLPAEHRGLGTGPA